MRELRRVRPGEAQAVAALWQAVFGDSPAFLEEFYRRCLPLDRMWTAEEEGEHQAILSAPEVTVCCPDGKRLPGGYLYALATWPAARRRGLGRELMDHGAACLAEEGAACALLVPAQPSLFRFFAGLGYTPAFSHVRWEVAGEELPAAEGSLAPASAAEYNAIRRRWLSGRLYVDYTDELVAFQRWLARESGGDVLRLELPGGTGCAVVELCDGLPLVKELLCRIGDEPAAAALIAARYPAPRHILRLPPWTAVQGERVPWGAVKLLGECGKDELFQGVSGYLGLAFD